jgi:hypothetical protein
MSKSQDKDDRSVRRTEDAREDALAVLAAQRVRVRVADARGVDFDAHLRFSER